MKRLSQNTRFIWALEKSPLDHPKSNLSSQDQNLLDQFFANPNLSFLKAEKVSQIETQDGVTERWKYSLNEHLFVIVEGYLPGPWSTVTSGDFHYCIAQEIHIVL